MKDLKLFKLNTYFKRAKFTLDFKTNLKAFLFMEPRVNIALLKYIFQLKRLKSFKTVCRQRYLTVYNKVIDLFEIVRISVNVSCVLHTQHKCIYILYKKPLILVFNTSFSTIK